MMFDYGWDEYYSLPYQTCRINYQSTGLTLFPIQCLYEMADFGGEEYEKLWNDIFEWFDVWFYKQLREGKL